jgi:hypothetical protein
VESISFLKPQQDFACLFADAEPDKAALVDRRQRGLQADASTSSRSSSSSSASDEVAPTELIITFEKYGSGWGEELLPRASIVQRPIEKKQRFRNRSGFPDPWAVSHSFAAIS